MKSFKSFITEMAKKTEFKGIYQDSVHKELYIVQQDNKEWSVYEADSLDDIITSRGAWWETFSSKNRAIDWIRTTYPKVKNK